MKPVPITATLVAACALSACATLFGNASDQLTISSTDPYTNLYVNGTPIGTGSANYTLERGKTATITANRPGCTDTVITTDKTVVPATFFNILFFPGFLVDWATGKISKADPTYYSVTPHCNTAVVAPYTTVPNAYSAPIATPYTTPVAPYTAPAPNPYNAPMVPAR